MEIPVVIDSGSSSREMCRRLRTGLSGEEGEVMPESVAWHLFLELRRRGEPDAGRLFVGALRTLHSRRTIAAVSLGNATDSFKYISPGGNHGSSIATLAQADQDAAVATVMRWAGLAMKPKTRSLSTERTVEQDEFALRRRR